MAKAASARNRRRVIDGFALAEYRASTGRSTASHPSALWTLPGRSAHRSRSPNWLQVAELVEYEERVQALRLEVAVPDRSFLVAMHRALRAVHVERNRLGRAPIMHGIDPAAGQIRENREVLGPRQHLGLEPPDGGRGRGPMLDRTAPDELADDRSRHSLSASLTSS